MGSSVSCMWKPVEHVRILDLDGNLRHVEIPIKVAEIMLEAPGKFVSPAEEIMKAARVLAMRADDELQAGKLYVLFPAWRLNSRASTKEMILVDEACFRRSDGCSGVKVFLEAAVEEDAGEGIKEALPRLRISVEEGEESDTGFPCHRLINYRQWKPDLETIAEAKLE